MKKILSVSILIFLLVNIQAKTYNIADLGADTKGVEPCSQIINKAIQMANVDGGGTLFFPAGIYLTGPIHLKSNITLNVESGATIKFSDNFNDYLPFVKIRYEGVFMQSFSPLIYAEGCENIALTGTGKLIGNGSKWWEEFKRLRAEANNADKDYDFTYFQKKWENENENFKATESFRKTARYKFFRPPFIQFIECKNITIEGITIKDSPFWTINPVGSEDIDIHGVRIFNPEEGPNTDGINPSSCKNVRISDCYISVGDDCITIKSGRDEAGREYARPCENISITNCIMENGHGGVVIGSEMSGGVKNVVISNCIFDGTDNGIRLKSARGRGGIVEAISVSNIVMRNIQWNAFIFNLYYDKKSVVEEVSERTPVFRNIHISNVIGTDVNQAGFIRGIEEMPVSDIHFSNINIQAKKGFIANTAKNISFKNVEISASEGPSIEFENCSVITVENVQSNSSLPTWPVLHITNCQSVFLSSSYPINCSENYVEYTNSDIITNNICTNNSKTQVKL